MTETTRSNMQTLPFRIQWGLFRWRNRANYNRTMRIMARECAYRAAAQRSHDRLKAWRDRARRRIAERDLGNDLAGLRQMAADFVRAARERETQRLVHAEPVQQAQRVADARTQRVLVQGASPAAAEAHYKFLTFLVEQGFSFVECTNQGTVYERTRGMGYRRVD